jgi:hypothetical protein
VILIPGERRQRECTFGPRAGQKEVKVQYDVVGTRAQLDFRTNESVRCYLHFPHRGGEELHSPAAIVSLGWPSTRHRSEPASAAFRREKEGKNDSHHLTGYTRAAETVAAYRAVLKLASL